jgi:hypothetical protein
VQEREERMKNGGSFGPFELYYGNRDPTEYAHGPEFDEVSVASVM